MARARGCCALCGKGITRKTRSMKLRHEIKRSNLVEKTERVIAPVGDKVHWSCYNRTYGAGYLNAKGDKVHTSHPIFGVFGTRFKSAKAVKE